MSWPLSLIIALLGVISGVLSDLAAGILEGSLGQYTPFRAFAMVSTVVVVVVLAVSFEHWWTRRDMARRYGPEIDQQDEKLHKLRLELYKLQDRYNERNLLWNAYYERIWLDYQREIETTKEILRDLGGVVPFDPIDHTHPPSPGPVIEAVRVLFILPVLIGLAFLLSPVAEYAYLDHIATPTPTAMPIPLPTNTPLPSPTATPIPPTPTATVTPSETPTPSATARPSATTVPSETPTWTVTPSATPTPTPSPWPTTLFTPTPRPTSTPRPTPTPTRPAVYPTPSLIGIDVIACNVTFKWSLPLALVGDEWFDVRLGLDGARPSSLVWTKSQTHVFPLREPGEYSWEIAICRGQPGQYVCVEQLAVSARASFTFMGCESLAPSPTAPAQ